jgi:hypothetical protein
MAGNYASSLITNSIKSYDDNREDPNKYLQQRDNKTVAANVVGNTLKGAGIGATVGSVIPGLGTVVGGAIGAGVGALSSGIKNALTSKKKKQARLTDQENWGKAWTGDAEKRLSTNSYKEGGKKEKTKVSVPVTTTPPAGADPNYRFLPGQTAKDEVTNNYWRPETRKNVGLELLKKGHFGSVQDTVATLKQWDSMPPEETLKYINEQAGIDATIDPNNPKTANPGGIRYWVKDKLPAVNGKTIRNSNFSDMYFDAKKKSTFKASPTQLTTGLGMAKGGKIKGEGGPKEDAIDKNVSDGSFIVPAENAQKAMELGKNYLNWKGDETANRKYPGTEVALSNGEVLFTPEEVDVLKYHGLDLNRLAPEAEPGNKMKKGGEKYADALATYAKQYKESSPNATDAEIESDFKDMIAANPGMQVNNPVDPNAPPDKGPLGKIMDFAPEIAGAIQIGAAGVGLAKAGRMPDINVSEALREITNESRQDAQYGLEPGTKAAMLNQAEKARRDTTNAVVNRGGSAAEVMSNLQGILSTTTDKKFDIELADSSEKIRKKGIYFGLKSKVADQQFDISKMARQDWLQLQEVNAGLLSSGISNIVGARKLKMEMDTMKKIGSSSADWSTLK